jgi:hypothetical protein
MFIQGNRPVIAHANDMIKEIGHPKYPTSLLSLYEITIPGRRWASFASGPVNLMITHSLHQAECSTGTHPRLPMVSSHRFEYHDKDPRLGKLCVDVVVIAFDAN